MGTLCRGVPNFVPTQPIHRREYCVFRWVDIATRHGDRAMPSDPSERPGITSGFPKASQEGVTQRIEDKRAHRICGILCLLGLQRPECTSVLFL